MTSKEKANLNQPRLNERPFRKYLCQKQARNTFKSALFCPLQLAENSGTFSITCFRIIDTGSARVGRWYAEGEDVNR